MVDLLSDVCYAVMDVRASTVGGFLLALATVAILCLVFLAGLAIGVNLSVQPSPQPTATPTLTAK